MKKKHLVFFMILLLAIASTYLYLKQENKYPSDDEQAGLNEQIVIKFSHIVAKNTPKGQAAEKFADLVQEKTNNKVRVEVYPNGSLYSEKEAIEALRQGSIQMIAPATSKMSTFFPKLELFDLPYAFPTYDAIYEVFNGEIGTELLESMERENLVGLSYWSNGFKQMTSSKRALINPNDFSNHRFRIMPSDVIEQQFEALNAETSRISFNLTYRNIEQGLIDGQENTISNIYSKKFYKVQDYMTISNHGFLSYVVMVDQEFWSNLPNHIQTAIKDAMEETTAWNQQHAMETNQQALRLLKNSSDIKIHTLSEAEKAAWREKFQAVYDNFEPTIGEEWMDQLIGE
ncbi:TRAP transporter substrate-binding protein [Pontibacillus sp. HMF3514]|uniref:TRAP transporter substrate-binding protein n=1 Tax=Pontibacillus sp. HMF3514 TaxID=2692425 RepID=UPI001320020A|nr:TRAP transporter substrate-binding protein [Pontibacillus sp. HMF3514]QHE51730.1 DctP family TRAP transporter solute-binding subunit [Pontibacillus sp. HMF3514]